MQEKRKRILQMLESGTISMDEALSLLEKLQTESSGDKEKTHHTGQQKIDFNTEDESFNQKSSSSEKDEPSMDEFLDSLRKDFTMVGDRFMQFMQTAVQKVKDIDIESPFGKSFVFNHTLTQSAEEIEEISLAIPSGKVTLLPSDEADFRAEFTVKGYSNESDETAKEELLEKIAVTTDGHKLQVSSEVKIGQVDLDLYVPKKNFKVITARLTNGRFKAEQVQANLLKVKSTNGAIRLNNLICNMIEAETLNGLIYIEGDINEVEAQSLNGAVSVTTTSETAEKIDAKTVTGLVELYIPSTVSLTGKLSSTMGKIDLGLDDVDQTSDQDQLFQKSTHFYKVIPEQSQKLRIKGETKTGTVLVRYNN